LWGGPPCGLTAAQQNQLEGAAMTLKVAWSIDVSVPSLAATHLALIT
jgi:hypothetical protein